MTTETDELVVPCCEKNEGPLVRIGRQLSNDNGDICASANEPTQEHESQSGLVSELARVMGASGMNAQSVVEEVVLAARTMARSVDPAAVVVRARVTGVRREMYNDITGWDTA